MRKKLFVYFIKYNGILNTAIKILIFKIKKYKILLGEVGRLDTQKGKKLSVK